MQIGRHCVADDDVHLFIALPALMHLHIVKLHSGYSYDQRNTFDINISHVMNLICQIRMLKGNLSPDLRKGGIALPLCTASLRSLSRGI